ncbi:hypothetical protein ACH4LT_28745 [Streptomyces clavifer]|uniref:DUF6414 family protein n=1 Tax=Streptomyces clavifer TaxID=68188 RepID=UPI0037B8FB1C
MRDYLYVDTPRVRTLLAQLSSGLPEEKRSDHTRRWTDHLTGTEGPGHEEMTSDQEVRSLAELHVAMLEDDSEYTEMLLDVSDVSKKSKNWNRGRLHKALHPGSLIRVKGPTSVIHPASFAASVAAFDAFSEDSEFAKDVSKIVHAMYGQHQHLTLRVFPCGENEWEYQYSGVISDPGNYLAGEREVLFSRLGADPQEWTTLAMISRIPERDSTSPAVRFERAISSLQAAMGDGEEVNRLVLERMIQETSRAMEGMGLSEAPTWPAISVIPLAVYRTVRPSRITPELELDD